MAGRTLVVGIAGGSGAGKTSLVEALARELAPTPVVVVSADWYYRDLRHLDHAARAATNFDDPAAIDVDALSADLAALRAGATVEAPVYCFRTHTRAAETRTIRPAAVILVEGICLYHTPSLRRLFDVRVFLDTPGDVRLARRILRDVGERGRTVDGVISQYFVSVRPMHERWVEPQRRVSQVVVPNHGPLEDAVALVMRRLRAAVLVERDQAYVRS